MVKTAVHECMHTCMYVRTTCGTYNMYMLMFDMHMLYIHELLFIPTYVTCAYVNSCMCTVYTLKHRKIKSKICTK